MYQIGDVVVRTKNDYYGSSGYVAIGTRGEITEGRQFGKIFRVLILDGPCAGSEHTWAGISIELVAPAKILWEV